MQISELMSVVLHRDFGVRISIVTVFLQKQRVELGRAAEMYAKTGIPPGMPYSDMEGKTPV